jgi:hypothetical protein
MAWLSIILLFILRSFLTVCRCLVVDDGAKPKHVVFVDKLDLIIDNT